MALLAFGVLISAGYAAAAVRYCPADGDCHWSVPLAVGALVVAGVAGVALVTAVRSVRAANSLQRAAWLTLTASLGLIAWWLAGLALD
jgi:heme/copper-type cytochrome/quinol oxidase subunit 3